MSSSPHRDLIYDLLAPPLILATPFVSFVNHNDYSYAAAEVWISLAGLAAVGLLCGALMALGPRWLRILVMAGLVTLFVDLQFDVLNQQAALRVPAFGIAMLLLCWLLRDHLSRIAAPAFATMLTATLAFPGAPGEASYERQGLQQDARREPKPAPPVLVHLIFDGFIGLEGIPSDVALGPAVRDTLRSFFHANGLHLFGRAYSRFIFTNNAIPNTLNYASIPEDLYFMSDDALRRNRYFKDMFEQGYKIHVYQTDAMDFCAGYEVQVVSCSTFINTGIKPLEPINMSLHEKAEVMVEIFSRTSVIQHVFGLYYTLLRQKVLERGYYLPPWIVGRHSLAPERALHALSSIAEDVAKAQPGEMFFAHVLLPHRPYVLDRTCNMRDPKAWDVQTLDDEHAADRAEARKRHYALYLEQILCVRAKLQEMFDGWRRSGIYERMKIIVHGDHGSRIFLHNPIPFDKHDVLASDYTDSFSTLFAFKAPGLEPAYDTRMVAIQDLLMPVAHEHSLDALPTGATEPYVLLENGASMVRQPMPDFGDSRGQHRLYPPQR